jgi:hypothetical protein
VGQGDGLARGAAAGGVGQQARAARAQPWRMMAMKPLSPAAASVRLRPTVTTCAPLAAMLSASTWGDG